MKLNKILAQPRKKESRVVIPTGIASLDKTIGGGLHIGQICTVAGRPGMGTSTFAMSVARNAGILNKIPTAILSFEVTEEMVVDRLFAAELGWGTYRYNMKLDPKEWSDDAKTAISILEDIGFASPEMTGKIYLQKMKEAPVWIEYCSDVTVDEIIGRIERIKKTGNIQLLILDGIEWIFAGLTNGERDIMMLKLTQTASRLNIAILLTAGITRDVEYRSCNKRPTLADLKGGSCLATFSSLVILLYRPEYYGDDRFEDGMPAKALVDLIIGKSYNGYAEIVRAQFAHLCRFEDMNKTKEELLNEAKEDLQEKWCKGCVFSPDDNVELPF